jgi:hypothetical protein
VTTVRLRLYRGQRGQSLVEFAFAAPLLITFVLATVEVGHMAHNHLIVLGAARDAARLGARGGTDADMRALVTVETAQLPTPAVPTSCGSGTSPGMCITRGTTPGPNSVKMQVCYNHALLVGVPGLFTSPRLMCSETVMRILTV